MDFSDPDSPIFCPCTFLLCVAIHLFAETDPQWSIWAWHSLRIVKRCYMEVHYERQQRSKKG